MKTQVRHINPSVLFSTKEPKCIRRMATNDKHLQGFFAHSLVTEHRDSSAKNKEK